MGQGDPRHPNQDRSHQAKRQDGSVANKPCREVLPKNDCSFFGLVLIPKGEIWWLPVEVIVPRSSVCTNIDTDQLAEFGGNFESLKNVIKSVIGFWGVQKPN